MATDPGRVCHGSTERLRVTRDTQGGLQGGMAWGGGSKAKGGRRGIGDNAQCVWLWGRLDGVEFCRAMGLWERLFWEERKTWRSMFMDIPFIMVHAFEAVISITCRSPQNRRTASWTKRLYFMWRRTRPRSTSVSTSCHFMTRCRGRVSTTYLTTISSLISRRTTRTSGRRGVGGCYDPDTPDLVFFDHRFSSIVLRLKKRKFFEPNPAPARPSRRLGGAHSVLHTRASNQPPVRCTCVKNGVRAVDIFFDVPLDTV